MSISKINFLNDCKIKNALEKLNEQYYYGCASIDIDSGIYLCTDDGDLQNYFVRICFQGRSDMIHFQAKSDGSGNVDCIRIIDRDGIEKLIDIINRKKDFWGFNISNIEKQVPLSRNDKAFYLLTIKN